jgi:hypothetical protein
MPVPASWRGDIQYRHHNITLKQEIAFMQKWEYAEMVGKTVKLLGKRLFRKEFNLTERGAWDELGDEGWELVSVVADAQGEFHYFFKRPVEEKAKKDK